QITDGRFFAAAAASAKEEGSPTAAPASAAIRTKSRRLNPLASRRSASLRSLVMASPMGALICARGAARPEPDESGPVCSVTAPCLRHIGPQTIRAGRERRARLSPRGRDQRLPERDATVSGWNVSMEEEIEGRRQQIAHRLREARILE